MRRLFNQREDEIEVATYDARTNERYHCGTGAPRRLEEALLADTTKSCEVAYILQT